MIELIGDRVRLRAFRPEEHDRFVASRLAFEEGISVALIPEDELRRRAASSGEMTDLGLLLAIDLDGRAVGEIQAYRTGQPEGAFGLGISLFDAEDRGRGVGTEAIALLSGYLFQTLEARRVEGGTHVGNAPMIRVFERVGFVREGVLRDFFPAGDGGMDCAVYAMTKDDWESVRNRWTPTS